MHTFIRCLGSVVVWHQTYDQQVMSSTTSLLLG